MARVFTIDGTKVRELRERAGIRQPAFAATLGISQPHMSDIERGRRNASATLTVKIAEALGVTFDDITERTAAPART